MLALNICPIGFANACFFSLQMQPPPPVHTWGINSLSNAGPRMPKFLNSRQGTSGFTGIA